MAEPNAREVELAQEVDAEYDKASETAETVEEAGERCRELFARRLAAYREELASDRAFLDRSIAALRNAEAAEEIVRMAEWKARGLLAGFAPSVRRRADCSHTMREHGVVKRPSGPAWYAYEVCAGCKADPSVGEWPSTGYKEDDF